MVTTDAIERALQAVLPSDQQTQAQRLATILADAANGLLSQEDARDRIAALPDSASLIASLAGQRIQANHSVLSFGADGQFGNVSIRDIVGRDFIQLHQTIVYQTPVAVAEEPAPAVSFARYLEEVQANILAAFRQDTYVMLNVEPIEREDPHTLMALQQALHSAFDIQVSEAMRAGGIPKALIDAIIDRRLVAILGDPKTTSLRYLALQQIRALHHNEQERIPLWVSLGRWEDQNLAASDFLWNEFCSTNHTPPMNQKRFGELALQDFPESNVCSTTHMAS